MPPKIYNSFLKEIQPCSVKGGIPILFKVFHFFVSRKKKVFFFKIILFKNEKRVFLKFYFKIRKLKAQMSFKISPTFLVED